MMIHVGSNLNHFQKTRINKRHNTKRGYDVRKYIYTMSQFEIPRWIEKSYVTDTWSKDSNWMGYIIVGNDLESKRIRIRDIVVVWCGTMLSSEWYEDMQRDLEPLGHGEAKVGRGFMRIYKSKLKRISTRYNKTIASEQVIEEIKRLTKFYKSTSEQVSLTVIGHNLGGTLALLNTYAAMRFPTLLISVISFGAPRVENITFRDEHHHRGIKALWIIIKQDLVPRIPGIVVIYTYSLRGTTSLHRYSPLHLLHRR
ncbi:unnamed protein product [Lactuca virosa]|uniref:Fungal lipase-type domain-containing protein n=1 Tax=Lactuca virosa TaxID=75947 RepID=A0AAU9MWL4_9ASTR|nr:unnamed protein product [Lactuca virosa]